MKTSVAIETPLAGMCPNSKAKGLCILVYFDYFVESPMILQMIGSLIRNALPKSITFG